MFAKIKLFRNKKLRVINSKKWTFEKMFQKEGGLTITYLIKVSSA